MSTSSNNVKTELIDVDTIALDDDLRGRKVQPTKSEIETTALSIDQEGQLHEIRVRPVKTKEEKEKYKGKKYICVYGHTRCESIKLLKDDKKSSHDGKVRAQVVDVDEKTAFSATVRENIDRKETNVVDDAFNQERMRKDYGMSEKEIADFYSCSAAWVSQVKRLQHTSTKVQTAIANGILTPTAAIEIVGTGKDGRKASEQNDLLAAAVAGVGNEKVSRASVRKVSKPSGNGPVTPSSGAGLSAAKIRAAFLEDTQEGASTDDVTWKELCAAMLMFIDGKRKFAWFYAQAEKFRTEPVIAESVESDDTDPSDKDLQKVDAETI